MARPQLAEEEKERFRDEVIEAGLDMVAEEGVSSLTLRRLAERLGCSYGKPHRYFGDKEHLVDAVRGRAFERFAAFAERASAAGDLTSDVYLRFVLENREAYRVMFELRQDYISPETRDAEARAWRAWSAPIHEAVDAGHFSGDPEIISHVVWAALHGLASLHLAGKLHHGKSLEDVLGGIAEVLRGPSESTSGAAPAH